jgi:hypothetical protein
MVCTEEHVLLGRPEDAGLSTAYATIWAGIPVKAITASGEWGSGGDPGSGLSLSHQLLFLRPATGLVGAGFWWHKVCVGAMVLPLPGVYLKQVPLLACAWLHSSVKWADSSSCCQGCEVM